MDALAPDLWQRLLLRSPGDATLCPLYGPLLAPPSAPDGCFVLGRLAQSLDGRIATGNGELGPGSAARPTSATPTACAPCSTP